MDCTWTEKQGGALVVNMTQLPALLSTACLHRIVPLSKISSSSLTVQVRALVPDCTAPSERVTQISMGIAINTSNENSSVFEFVL